MFNEAHPVESELKRLRESIWGRGSESVRLRGISVARRAAMLGERAAPPPPPLPPLASRAAAFENMRAVMASRFTSASPSGDGGKGTSTGGITASHGDLGGRLPGLTIVKSKEQDNNFSSQDPSPAGPTTTFPSPLNLPGRPCVPTVEKPTVERLPVRSMSLWHPCPLLCKRLNVPIPEISKAVGWGRQGEEVLGTSTSSSAALTLDLLKETRRDERRPLAGGGGSVISKDEASAVNLKTDPSHPEKPMVDSTMTTDESLVDVERANRPEIDLFKSIFEADSDMESNSNDSSTPEKGDDGEARRAGISNTLPFSSSSPVMLPQWSSAAAAVMKGEETSSSTTTGESDRRNHSMKFRSSSPSRRKKRNDNKVNNRKKKKHKKKNKKKSHHKRRHQSE